MTSRLVPGIFDWHEPGLFGLKYEQTETIGKSVVGNDLAWFNDRGEYIGFGDLTGERCQRIAAELQDGEMFIALYPEEGHWHFDRCRGPECAYGQHSRHTPGWPYLADHAAYIILPGRMIYASDLHKDAGVITIGGVEWEEMPKPQAKVFLLEQFEAMRLCAQRALPKPRRFVYGKLHNRYALQTPVKAFPWTQLDIRNRHKGQDGIHPFYVDGLMISDVFCGQRLRLGLVDQLVVEVAIDQGNGDYKVVFPAPPA